MKRKWIALVAITLLVTLSLVGSIAAQGSFPQTPVLDYFNRANEGPPPSASWVPLTSYGLVVDSSECIADPESSEGWGLGVWNADIGPDSEAFVTVITPPDPDGLFTLYVRYGVSSGYEATFIRDEVEGNYVRLCPYGGECVYSDKGVFDITSGDSAGIRAVSSNIYAWYKESSGSWTQMLAMTDTATTGSGYIGLRIDLSPARMDDFGGGTITITPTPTPTPPIVIGELDIDLDFDAIMEYVNMILAGLAGLFELLIGIALGYAVVAKLVRVWRESRA